MKTKLLSIISIFALLFSLQAQTETPVLKSSDVENFINHYKSIEDELEALDLEISPSDDVESMVEAVGDVNKVNTIVQKYGYADYLDFTAKTWAIVTCYSSIKMQNQEGFSQIDIALQEIDNNETMTAEEKEMAKQQIKAIMQAMGTSFASSANEQDIKTVKPYVSKLDAILEDE